MIAGRLSDGGAGVYWASDWLDCEGCWSTLGPSCLFHPHRFRRPSACTSCRVFLHRTMHIFHSCFLCFAMTHHSHIVLRQSSSNVVLPLDQPILGTSEGHLPRTSVTVVAARRGPAPSKGPASEFSSRPRSGTTRIDQTQHSTPPDCHGRPQPPPPSTHSPGGWPRPVPCARISNSNKKAGSSSNDRVCVQTETLYLGEMVPMELITLCQGTLPLWNGRCAAASGRCLSATPTCLVFAVCQKPVCSCGDQRPVSDYLGRFAVGVRAVSACRPARVFTS